MPKHDVCRRRILAKKGLRVATVRENDWKSLDDQKELPGFPPTSAVA